MTKRDVKQGTQRESQLKANVSRSLGDGPRPPDLRHGGHDEGVGDDARGNGGDAVGQAGGVVPDGVVVRVVVAAAEGEVLDGDDADKRGGPVADEGDKVLEVDEEVALGADGDGNDDDGDDNGKGVAGDLDEAGDEGLEVERDGVHGSGRVAEEGEGEDHDDKFAETAGAVEHGGEDTADQGLVVGL